MAAGELLAAALQQGDAANLEDEELLRALQQTDEIGELEATDLMQFAYQIASGMVCMPIIIVMELAVYSFSRLGHWR